MDKAEKLRAFEKELKKIQQLVSEMGGNHSKEFEEIKEVIDHVVDNKDSNLGDLFFTINAVEEILSYEIGLDKQKSHVSYAPLKGIVAKYGISLTTACDAIGASSTVRKALSNDLPVSTTVLNKLAMLLHCDFDDLVEVISEDEKLRRRKFGERISKNPRLYSHIINKQTIQDPSEQDKDVINTKIGGLHFKFNSKEEAYKVVKSFLELDNDK